MTTARVLLVEAAVPESGALAETAPQPITAECFPTPHLILRSNDPATQQGVREFAHKQAEAEL